MNFDYNSITNNETVSYIGQFVLDATGETMNYINPHKKPNGKNDNSIIKSMGDIVYYMFVNKQLVKIGKAGGANGFIGRASTYTPSNPKHNDSTNRMIIRKLVEMQEDTIEIYAIPTPRAVTNFKCPISGDQIRIEAATHGAVETAHTAKALEEGFELPFCTQKK